MDNEVFDIVIANPPYSVSGFKTTLNNGKDSFELFDEITNKSNEIECLFLERTKQLLRIGGVAGIILPTSILEGQKIYGKVREILFDNFEIKGIVKLGKKTFMCTDTSTIILFLKRVKNKKEDNLYYLNESLEQSKDLTINEIQNPIKKYLEATYKISFETYLDFFSNQDVNNSKLMKIKIYMSYVEAFNKQRSINKLNDFVKEKEINKLLYFISTFNKKVIFYNIPLEDAKEQKKILGYGFSERRGYEGIYILRLGGQLYNPKVLLDKQKVNYYILNNFRDNEIELNNEIPYLSCLNLHEMIEFNDVACSKIININQYEVRKNKTSAAAEKALMKLKESAVREKVRQLLEEYSVRTSIKKIPMKQLLKKPMETGDTPLTRVREYWEDGTINWLNIGDIKKHIYETEKKITELGRKSKNLLIFEEETILFSIFATIGKMGILKTKTTINQAICAFIPDENIVLPDYLYYSLFSERDEILKACLHRTQDNFNKTKLEEWEIPVILDKHEQLNFIKEINEFENSYTHNI